MAGELAVAGIPCILLMYSVPEGFLYPGRDAPGCSGCTAQTVPAGL